MCARLATQHSNPTPTFVGSADDGGTGSGTGAGSHDDLSGSGSGSGPGLSGSSLPNKQHDRDRYENEQRRERVILWIWMYLPMHVPNSISYWMRSSRSDRSPMQLWWASLSTTLHVRALDSAKVKDTCKHSCTSMLQHLHNHAHAHTHD